MKKLGIFCLLFVLALSSCRKDTNNVTVIETPFVPPIIENWEQRLVTVNGSVTGFVADENGEPVANVDVTIGNMNTTTDEYGHFFYKDVNLNAKGTLVKANKAGYFNGSRRFFAIENVENRLTIQLITKNFNDTFDAQTGTTISMNGGATVKFAPNSIQNPDGSPYTGNVRVASKYLDPSDINTFDQMPGNLQGVNRLAEEVALGTAGMIVVELENEAGDQLNILEGFTAEISMPVPSNLQGNAPAEVPLWSYNEEHGIWVEEGASQLVGDNYVGEVSHFSFWNHDFFQPLVDITATFVDEDGTPLENYKVLISEAITGTYGYGHTCDEGIINGLIPIDFELLLEVYGVCNEVVYSQTIGPFSSNADLGTITITASTLNATTVTGELVDCNGDPIANGIAVFKFNGQTVYEYTDGTPFEVLFSTCVASADIEVYGVDIDALLQSDVISITSGGVTDLGAISVCDIQLQNYIRLNVDGDEVVFTPASVFPDSVGGTYISYYGQNNQDNIFLIFNGETVGSYGGLGNNFIEVIFVENNGWALNNQEGFDDFEVTAFGNVGEPIIGNFSGTLTNSFTQPATLVSVTGDFNIIRQ